MVSNGRKALHLCPENIDLEIRISGLFMKHQQQTDVKLVFSYIMFSSSSVFTSTRTLLLFSFSHPNDLTSHLIVTFLTLEQAKRQSMVTVNDLMSAHSLTSAPLESKIFEKSAPL